MCSNRLKLNFTRDSNQDILGQVLGLIIAQLGRQNPVVKGLAAMQVGLEHFLCVIFSNSLTDRILSKTPSKSAVRPYSSSSRQARTVHGRPITRSTAYTV